MAQAPVTDAATVLDGRAGLGGPSPAVPGELAATSTEQIMEMAAEKATEMAALTGCLLQLVGELDRREGWRAEGATSLESWMAERCGFSERTCRVYAHAARRMWDLPHLSDALAEGQISFDKVRTLVDVATPETDRRLRDQARTHSLRGLSELVRSIRRDRSTTTPQGDETQRRSLRCNDMLRTLAVQLPADSYAEVRGRLEAHARRIPSDGETPWDQRLCDAFLVLMRADVPGPAHGPASPHLVVTHVPLNALVDGEGWSEASALAGELERDGFISVETVRRIACDATIVLAVDDDVGHTMYEGRARRFPTETQRREIMRRDRHCRFPGCGHVTFTNAHHVRPWKPDGRTDIDNLVLLCEHHHRLMHSRHWELSGDANEVLTFVGPTGRVTTSQPSPLWTVLTRPDETAARGTG